MAAALRATDSAVLLSLRTSPCKFEPGLHGESPEDLQGCRVTAKLLYAGM